MYIHMYKNNPTAGGTDGTLVSEGTGVSPIDAGELNATENQESAAIKLAIRCESGYQTNGATNITLIDSGSGTKAKWALSADSATWEEYGATLTISSVIGDTNTVFYAKAKATSDETPVNDDTVDFQVDAVIAAI